MTIQLIKEWKGATSKSKNITMRPRIEIVDENEKLIKLSNGNKAIYELPVDAVLSVSYVSGGKKKVKVNPGDLLARIPLDSQKSKENNLHLIFAEIKLNTDFVCRSPFILFKGWNSKFD